MALCVKLDLQVSHPRPVRRRSPMQRPRSRTCSAIVRKDVDTERKARAAARGQELAVYRHVGYEGVDWACLSVSMGRERRSPYAVTLTTPSATLVTSVAISSVLDRTLLSHPRPCLRSRPA